MKKIRYEIDPHNRLVLDESGRKGELSGFRQVLDGSFKTDKFNELSYLVKAPLSASENIPHQIRLKGEWSLTENHDLRLTLDKSGRDTFGDQITLQGEILDVNKNSLLFAITTTTKENTRSTYVLELGGSWKADEFNRLSFHVKREKGAYDILTFNAAWQINKNHEISYQYEKASLLVKKRKAHALTFKGYWDIKDALRISYLLSGDTDSEFIFKTSAGIFKDDSIQYELGIGVTGSPVSAKRAITLFGKWSLKKDVGFVFEIEYGNKKTRAIVFGADVRLTGRDTVSVRLKTCAEFKDMGASLELSRKILKGGGEAFLKILKEGRELAVYSGAAWKW